MTIYWVCNTIYVLYVLSKVQLVRAGKGVTALVGLRRGGSPGSRALVCLCRGRSPGSRMSAPLSPVIVGALLGCASSNYVGASSRRYVKAKIQIKCTSMPKGARNTPERTLARF